MIEIPTDNSSRQGGDPEMMTAHDMVHAYRHATGLYQPVRGRRTPVSEEVMTCRGENQIRVEQGEPPRTDCNGHGLRKNGAGAPDFESPYNFREGIHRRCRSRYAQYICLAK